MKSLDTQFFKISSSSSVIFMIFGIILFIYPKGIFEFISIIIGLCLFLYGFFQISLYLKNKILFKYNLLFGLFPLIIGILLIFDANVITTFLPFLIGIFILSTGIKKLQLALSLKNEKIIGWKQMLIVSILILIIALMLILNPIKGALFATRLLGLIIIIYSIIDISCGIFIKKKFNNSNVKIIEER